MQAIESIEYSQEEKRLDILDIQVPLLTYILICRARAEDLQLPHRHPSKSQSRAFAVNADPIDYKDFLTH